MTMIKSGPDHKIVGELPRAAMSIGALGSSHDRTRERALELAISTGAERHQEVIKVAERYFNFLVGNTLHHEQQQGTRDKC